MTRGNSKCSFPSPSNLSPTTQGLREDSHLSLALCWKGRPLPSPIPSTISNYNFFSISLFIYSIWISYFTAVSKAKFSLPRGKVILDVVIHPCHQITVFYAFLRDSSVSILPHSYFILILVFGL